MLDDLLRAIVEHPADDGARLVYADALLQAGDPRGELIVRQCRGDAAPDLVTQLMPAWSELLGPDVRIDRFERGFPAVIDLYLSEEHGLAALDHAPIRYLKLRHSRWDIHDEANEPDDFDHSILEPDPVALAAVFANDSRTPRIPTLDLSHAAWGDTAMPVLLAAKLPALRALYISDEDCSSDVAACVARAIERNATLALRELALCGDSYGDASAFLRVLCATPRAGSLRTLMLDNCGLTDDDMPVIAESPHLAALEHLGLTGGSNTTNEITDDGMIALVRSPHLRALNNLTLGNNAITDRGLAALIDPGHLPSLHSLALNHARITAATLAQVVAARPFENLFLGGCSQLGDDGLIAIARSPHIGRLRGLNLHGTNVGKAGITALIASPIGTLDYLGIKVDAEMQQILIERFGAAALGK
jgi:uncharacterized protein (TIGR02996 family)